MRISTIRRRRSQWSMNSEPGSCPDLSMPGDGTDSLPDDGEFGVISIRIARLRPCFHTKSCEIFSFAKPAEVTPKVL